VPCRFSDLVRALRALGITVEEPKRGSHFKAVRGGTVFPIPAHNALRSEVTDIYIRKLCRALQLDEAELRKLL
jgi:hypothetical protein